jgi:hypothetical protein
MFVCVRFLFFFFRFIRLTNKKQARNPPWISLSRWLSCLAIAVLQLPADDTEPAPIAAAG